MGKESVKFSKRRTIKKRVRKKISGTEKIPRFYVYKSNQRIYAGLADDDIGKVITSVCSISIDNKRKNVDIKLSEKTGVLIGEKAKALKIQKVVFDRSGYIYHGKIKALAEGARKAGLIF